MASRKSRRDGPRPATALRRLVHTPAGLLGGSLTLAASAVALFASSIAPGDPLASSGPALLPPSAAHPMGTDNLGRDVSRAVVHGMRTSMIVVVAVTVISLAIGVSIGITAGYRGGWLDDLLMRLTEVFQSIPLFFLALLAVGFLGGGLSNLILLLGLTSWELLARVVRAESLSVRQREFVEAARACGASDRRILLRHVLPNVVPVAVVVASLIGSRAILIEAALSFIGLGDPNTVSLGFLMRNAQAFLSVSWWMSVFPGVAIALIILGLNLLGDAVNDLLDPRITPTGTRRRRRRRPEVAASSPFS